MRHLSAIGSGDALAVFVWLVSAGQPMQQGWVEAMTGISDKNVTRALRKLKELRYAVQTTQGWMVAPAMAEQGVLGDVLAALPDEPDTPDPTLREASGNSGSAVDGVGVVLNNESTESKDSYIQQQQHSDQSGISGWLTEDSNSAVLPGSPQNLPAGDPERGRARLALLRAKVWPNQVETILAALRADYGLGDVLGWVAHCADPDQGVERSGAIVRGHLVRGEVPPTESAPPRVCNACHLIDGHCLCAEPKFHYPADYDDLAFEPPPAYGRDDWLANRWRCARCFGHPCQCEPEQGEELDQ